MDGPEFHAFPEVNANQKQSGNPLNFKTEKELSADYATAQRKRQARGLFSLLLCARLKKLRIKLRFAYPMTPFSNPGESAAGCAQVV